MIEEQNAPTAVLPAMPMPVGEAPAAPPKSKWALPATLGAVVILIVGLYFAMKPKPPEPVISTPTGTMVLVPAGEFLFGEKKEKVTLPAFYIDKTEVTNAAYARFCKESGRALPEGFPADRPNYPVVSVTILDALAYSQWAHLRLPNEREWEKAARGTDGRIYPWGNAADASRANVNTSSAQPADALPAGASPCGALNMVGNVYEFVQETKTPSDEKRATFATLLVPTPSPQEQWYTIRGLAFNAPELVPRVLYDYTTVPERWKGVDIGFRCVKDVR
jgi:formylglycine-generating enzyme required for sulfatase activity